MGASSIDFAGSPWMITVRPDAISAMSVASPTRMDLPVSTTVRLKLRSGIGSSG